MIVERKNNEILVRFSAGNKASKIQAILDYLRYEELTSKSEATEEVFFSKLNFSFNTPVTTSRPSHATNKLPVVIKEFLHV